MEFKDLTPEQQAKARACKTPEDMLALAKEESFYEYDQTKYAMGTGEAVAKRYCEILTALRDGTEVPAQVPHK
jgi:hypothetical protein